MLVPPTTISREVDDHRWENLDYLKEYWRQQYVLQGNRCTVLIDELLFGIILLEVAIQLEIPYIEVISHASYPAYDIGGSD